MCGFRMFKTQASNNLLFRFPALYVWLSSFVYFLKIFPFGLCFLAWLGYGFSKRSPLQTPLPCTVPHPQKDGKLFRWPPPPEAGRALRTMVPALLHLKAEGSWDCCVGCGFLSLTVQVMYPSQRNPIFSSSNQAFIPLISAVLLFWNYKFLDLTFGVLQLGNL